MYPLLTIDHEKIAANVRQMVAYCGQYGIEITGITKVVCGDPEIAKIYIDNGISRIGDSRVANLKKLAWMPCEKWLIRMPMCSEAEDVVRWADVSLNSELDTLKALARACRALRKTHKVVLMYDLGDIREGFLSMDEIRAAADYARQTPELELYGVGTNLTCFSFIQPDTEKLTLLTQVAEEIHATPCISGGNSATLDLMFRGGIPKEVNLLRLGESLLFGRERAKYRYLDGTYNDAFRLQAEIIELKEKPSLPWGTVGVDSYGNSPTFTDRGVRMKAICALGKQDIDVETMWPIDEGIHILGASSDHLMLDVEDSEVEYRVGDTIEFRLGYFALMRAYTSSYVTKLHLNRQAESISVPFSEEELSRALSAAAV
ncbi:MAG: alanine/ornithine racemase family PLP-dependent enzyme [Clostridiales bacterium]|nr:alanine/ornithine racemase family PLP-dependent enzyme [Clostridiales bacterium]